MPDGYTSHTEKHFRNPTLYRVPVLGRIACSFLIFLVWLAVFQLNGSTGHLSIVLAICTWAASEWVFYLFKRARLQRLNAKAGELQGQIHKLEQTASDLAIEEARKSGAFDQWEKK